MKMRQNEEYSNKLIYSISNHELKKSSGRSFISSRKCLNHLSPFDQSYYSLSRDFYNDPSSENHNK